MKLPYWGLLVLFLFTSLPSTYAQDKGEDTDPKPKVHKDVQKAYDAYEAQKYFEAIELLKTAFSKVKGRKDKTEVLFLTAEAYRMMNDYENAQKNYEKTIKLGYKDPIAQLYLADMLKAQGEYEEALVAYEEYKKLAPTDRKGEIGIESTKQAVAWEKAPSRYLVTNIKGLNSSNMDFSPIFGGKMRENNTILFVSSREESMGSKEDGWTGEEFMDIYTSTAERKKRRRSRGGDDDTSEKNPADLKWSTPIPLDEEIVNTKNHEGTACFDSRKKALYFTKCINEKEMKLGCAIYVTEKQGQNWKEPEQVIIGTDTNANVGHPTLSPDDKFLYFASDGFGAKGGKDIFVTTYNRREKRWEQPTNLGPKVNSDRDELYPFAHDDGYLYFSSNGMGGMGGLDIFRVKVGVDGMPVDKAENLQYPINTNWDDFGVLWLPGDNKIGYLSSNRKGGKGSDDIYSIFRTPLVFNLEGVVTSSKDGKPIPEATVKLDGSDGTSIQITADKDGYYIFDKEKIKEKTSYKLSFSKKKFLNNTGDVTTIGIPMDAFEFIPSQAQFLHTIRLNRTLDPIEVPIVLPNVFFDLAKWDLRPEAQLAMDSVVSILNNNPTIVIAMRSHTDYRDSEEKNQVLSQKRADTCVSYLVSKGIPRARLEARGMGEGEPFFVAEDYKGYGADQLAKSVTLTEKYIKSLSKDKQEVANQINRRTDFKVLRDDYVPSDKPEEEAVLTPEQILAKKETEAPAAGEIYVVGKRESFGTIARKLKISIRDLKSLNGGLRGVRPFEGLQLKIQKDGNYEEWDASHYQVKKRGETFRSIAKQLDMKAKDLEALNPDVDKKNLQVGLWIKTK